MNFTLTKRRAKKEVETFIGAITYKVSKDNKCIEFLITSTHPIYKDITWIIGRVKKSFGKIEAYGIGQKGERREYKTIRGLNNYFCKEYIYGVAEEKIKELFNQLVDSDEPELIEVIDEPELIEVIEIKNNISHVVNTSCITKGTIWSIKRYDNFIKCFRIDEKNNPVILHNEQIKLNINLLDFNRLVEDGDIIIPQTNQIEEQATPKAKGVEPDAVVGENKCPKIDINDIKKYTIDKSISDRENNRAFFRRTYINHTEELQEYFLSTNKAVEGIINNPLCTEKIRYNACKYLQSFKEKYYKAYKDYLIVKGNTPSWMETGRGNLNSRRYSKAHDRVDKKLLKVTDLVEKFNNKMKSFILELKGIKKV